MADRSSVSQIVQIGVETTPGTAVPATKRLQSMMITPSPKVTVQQFRPSGYKYDTLAVLGKEWSESAVTGNAVYDELIYPLSSILTTVTPTTTGTTGHKWDFVPATYAPDTPTTFTIEHGSAVRADRTPYGQFLEFSLDFNRERVEIGGNILSQQLQDPFTLTAGTTTVPMTPVIPSTLNVFADTTAVLAEGATPTQLQRVISVKWTLGNKVGPIWVLDSSFASYAGLVELVPTLTMDVTMEADAAGMAYLTTLRNSGTSYFAITGTGPQIGLGPATYAFKLYMPMKIVNTGGFKDDAGLYVIDWSAVGVYDQSFLAGTGGAMELSVTVPASTL
jgi:hypothetical protein